MGLLAKLLAMSELRLRRSKRRVCGWLKQHSTALVWLLVPRPNGFVEVIHKANRDS